MERQSRQLAQPNPNSSVSHLRNSALQFGGVLLKCDAAWLSFEARIGRSATAGKDVSPMSPHWLDDELNKRQAQADRDAQRVARQNVEAVLIAERAPGLMRALIAQAQEVVAQYSKRTGNHVNLDIYGDTGFSITGIHYPVRHLSATLNGQTVHVRVVTTKHIGATAQSAHSDVGFAVKDDTVYFRVNGSDMTPERMSEELLKPVLFPD